MAVTMAKKDTTIKIELAKAKTYTHFAYSMTFVKGGIYTFSENDAYELLGLQDAWGVPYFRRWVPEPTPEEKRDLDGEVRQQGVQALPKNDISAADLDGGEVTKSTKRKPPQRKAPKVVAATEPAPEGTPTVDSAGETDTGSAVEI
jgi:hypothetical protein